jgi:hypothetical protein
MNIPKFMWHHGTCDCCKEKFIMVFHFGYDTQPDRDYRMCEKCLKTLIAFGIDLRNRNELVHNIPEKDRLPYENSL